MHYRRVYHEGGDPLIPTCVMSKQIIIQPVKVYFFNGGHMYEFKTLICRFRKKTNFFQELDSLNGGNWKG